MGTKQDFEHSNRNLRKHNSSMNRKFTAPVTLNTNQSLESFYLFFFLPHVLLWYTEVRKYGAANLDTTPDLYVPCGKYHFRTYLLPLYFQSHISTTFFVLPGLFIITNVLQATNKPKDNSLVPLIIYNNLSPHSLNSTLQIP